MRLKKPTHPLRLAVIFANFLLIAAFFYFVDFSELLKLLLSWFEQLGAWRHVFYIGTFILLLIALLPTSPIELGAGILFPFYLGVLYVIAGMTLGAIVPFLIARYLIGEHLKDRLRSNEMFARLSHAAAGEGWKMAALSRVMPFFPIKLSNYLFGLTRLRLGQYALGIFLGLIPRALLTVYLGTLVGEIANIGESEPKTAFDYVMWGVGGVILIFGSIYITKALRKHAGAFEASRASGVDALATPERH